MISHTPAVLLFDREGKLAGTLSASEPNAEATAKLRRLIA
jgi:cytochrome oxidase Cu insertion factor (SCO1/SenC/PrrC family)